MAEKSKKSKQKKQRVLKVKRTDKSAIKTIVKKVIDTVSKPFQKKQEQTDGDSKDVKPKKKPFNGKGGRKKRPKQMSAEAKAELEKIKEDRELDEQLNEEHDNHASEHAQASNIINGFFYTNDKFMQQFEDCEIIEMIRETHPDYQLKTNDDMHTRQSIIKLLNDERLVEQILKKYSMGVMDFFKFLFRQDGSVFKGVFISRV